MTTSLSKNKILVVEDDADTCEILRFLFQQTGAQVVAVNSVEAALEVFQQWTPDALLADISMPGYDGYALIASVRELDTKRGKVTPAVALTAFVSPADRDRALTAGFHAYLAKPFDPAEVIQTVSNVINAAPQ